jgi:twinkle protein
MRQWSDTGIDTRGHSSGEIKTTCPKCSAQRKKKTYPCLNVNLDKGVWNCWHCGWSGSLKEGEYQRPMSQRKAYRRPEFAASSSTHEAPLVRWFADRGIPLKVLARNAIMFAPTYFPQDEAEHQAIQFPYRRDGQVINIKHRAIDEKLFRMEGGCERILYGLDDVRERQHLYWVEGEIDKLSLEAAGIQECVSVPDGAPAPDTKSYESKFDFLDAHQIHKADVHVIAVDNDPPGLRLRDELVRRLGPGKCRIVDWPEGCKDANDVLVNLGIDCLLDCLRDARELPIAGATKVREFMDGIQRIYREGVPRGVGTGWPGLDKLYRVRPGDVCVVTGTPNSGKSEWLDALVVNLAQSQGWRFGVYSPEQGSPEEHIAMLVEKRAGRPFRAGPNMDQISPELLDSTLGWLDDHIMFIGPDEPTLEAILGVAEEVVLRFGARGIVADPWNEIEHSRPAAMTETEYVGNSLRLIRHFARRHQIAFFLVAHPAKLQKDSKTGKYPVATPYDISGSAHWHNKPDVILSIWRDKSNGSTEIDIHVMKIRSKASGRLGMTTLTWDYDTGRYTDRQGAEAYRRRKDGDDE